MRYATRGAPAWSAVIAATMVIAACGSDDGGDAGSQATTPATASDEVTEAAEASGASESAEVSESIEVSESTETAADSEPASSGDKQEVLLWTHSAGNPAEMEKIDAWIDEFNATQGEFSIKYEAFPQGAYNETVVAGALSDSLPCILDIDGPNTPNWAWSGYLHALDIPTETTDALLPTLLGKWDDKLYSVGQFEAAVAMLARQSDLDEFGIRTPTVDEPWTAEEFQGVLDTYKASGKYEAAFDPGMAWTGEWVPYGFSPFLQSFGGDLIDRTSYLTAEGVLNGPEAVAWGEWWQGLFTGGYTSGVSQDPADRDSGFIDGKYGLQWNGIWAANAAIEALGDDVVFLPAPDFGSGPKIGAGSWQWAVSAGCEHPEVAQEWIEFLLLPDNIAAIADAQNVIPGSDAARQLTTKFVEGGALAPFYDLSAAQALIRPPTPAYTNIALVFEKAATDIANGEDVQTALDKAVDEIDADIEKNDGYGFG